MVDMMEKKISQLPSLESCSVDSDCNNVGKCEEVQNLGVRMCMPAFVRRMLRKNSAHLAKTCISENECAGSSKCMEFPKFEKHICLFENGLLHKMMVSIHDKFVKEDKDQPDNDTIEGKEEGKEDEGPEGENNLDNDDDDNNDDIDDDMDDAPFISDPQFLTKIDDNDEKFNNFIRTYRSYRKRGSWNMFFMGVFSMAGVVVLILFALLCCLTVKKRMAKKNIAKEESGEGGNNKLRNMFLTKIGTVQNPYSKLEEEKGVRI
ncbi:uncharacterized protein LOC133199323 [Saccostrea echinata]|uniref:uncharacterized protein LOC133199323 n=1 Tax=Saccostrea echinata TaxID=191078 RepID=UPI002A811381|nr:uncharacterized protein LOC133199323 [Saccostrea echinata]